MVVSHPFDKGGFDTADDTGEADVTDTGDLDTVDDKTDVDTESIVKTYKSREYLKEWSDDEYLKFVAKDSYAFLHGHEDEIIQVLTVGRDVAEYFKTLTVEEVRDVYVIILDAVEHMGWSSSDMVDKLMRKYPQLSEMQAKRIIRTEVSRVLFYAKELMALREDLGEYNYGWAGPLDERTTPMCWYMQTGELRDSDREALRRAGHTEADLPVIPEEGLPLEQLKAACRQTAEAFGSDMISDWAMHINCRHSFFRGNRSLDSEIATREQLDGILSDERIDEAERIMPLYPTDEAEPTFLDVETDKETLSYPMFDDYDSYIFKKSINLIPTMYLGDSDNTFIFEHTEREMSSYARMILELQDSGIDDATITWALKDEGVLTDGEINYMLYHSAEFYERAEREGWMY